MTTHRVKFLNCILCNIECAVCPDSRATSESFKFRHSIKLSGRNVMNFKLLVFFYILSDFLSTHAFNSSGKYSVILSASINMPIAREVTPF